MSDDQLRRDYPLVEWDKPIPILTPTIGGRYGCKFCIVRAEGVPALDREQLDRSDAFATIEEWQQHYNEVHSHQYEYELPD